MIIPAAVFRIVGFINKEKDSLENEVQEGGLVFCYTDQGNPVVLKLDSNKKDATVKDIKTYLLNKRDSVVKQKEIDAVAGELEYLEDFEVELEEALEKFKEENDKPDRKAIIKFKKEYKNEVATRIVKDRRMIKPGSIIRTVISLPNEGAPKKVKFKGVDFNLIQSRCIIFDNEGSPSTSGLYYYSQTANVLPISIEPIFNKEGQAINLFKVSLSKLAGLEHFNHLIDHIVRTVSRFIENNENAFLPNISYNYEMVKGKDIYSIIKSIRDLSSKKEVSTKEAEQFITLIYKLRDQVNEKPKYITGVQITFNLLLPKTFMETALEANSPFANIKKSFVNLNFSKENPDQKNEKKKQVENFINELSEGNRRGEIIATYNTPALKLSEPSDSWGFMHNNVQVDSFVLSSKDSFLLFKELMNK